MTAHNLSSAIVTAYPERNLFKMEPPLFNLCPVSRRSVLAYDTPEFLEAALKQAQKTGINPLNSMYGSNPLLLVDRKLLYAQLPPMAYQVPPPLARIELPDGTEFVKQLNKQGNTVIAVVKIDGKERLLKIFPEHKIDDVFVRNPDNSAKSKLKIVQVDRFEQEKDAYAHLLHHGICAKGTVPHCYGWLELSVEHRQRFAALPDSTHTVRMLPRVKSSVRAILLEYFPDAVQLSHESITEDLADKALRGLHEIHSAYVLHGDIHRRNILLLPGGRIVWVDFNFSGNPSSPLTCRRQELLEELYWGWIEFYNRMLPDKRIGNYQTVEEEQGEDDFW